jgi:hypothetical protein
LEAIDSRGFLPGFCRDFAGILPILATVDQGLGIDGTFHVHGTLTITP